MADTFSRIYLDNQATTQTDPRVVERMLPYFTKIYGNPSSTHTFGNEARAALSLSRDIIAGYFYAPPEDILFTGCASESINLVLKGMAEYYFPLGKKRIVTTCIEHPATKDTLKSLEKQGVEVLFLPVDKEGLICPDELESSLDDNTILVTIILANNEIGTLQDFRGIANICQKKNTPLHFDAAQAAGKIDFVKPLSGMDSPLLFSFSAHKFYGPKGIGGMYFNKSKSKIKFAPLIEGGGQEQGLRAGTENIPYIAGMAEALKLCYSSMNEESSRIISLRDLFLKNLTDANIDFKVNGPIESRIPNNLSITFPGVLASVLISCAREIAFSTGSACSSKSALPSPVLKAIGLTDEEVKSTVRLGFGRFNTEDEVNYSAAKFVKIINESKEK
ncbi:MAG: cysteine desulfurase family protein [Ignavibacteriaceae bacterium]